MCKLVDNLCGQFAVRQLYFLFSACYSQDKFDHCSYWQKKTQGLRARKDHSIPLMYFLDYNTPGTIIRGLTRSSLGALSDETLTSLMSWLASIGPSSFDCHFGLIRSTHRHQNKHLFSIHGGKQTCTNTENLHEGITAANVWNVNILVASLISQGSLQPYIVSTTNYA